MFQVILKHHQPIQPELSLPPLVPTLVPQPAPTLHLQQAATQPHLLAGTHLHRTRRTLSIKLDPGSTEQAKDLMPLLQQ